LFDKKKVQKNVYLNEIKVEQASYLPFTLPN